MGHTLNPPQRRPLRLREYDYARPGAYFITICTRRRTCLFGNVDDGQMRLNAAGFIVRECWDSLPEHYRHVELDIFVVMPNHVHGIIVLTEPAGVGAGLKPAPTERHPVWEVVRGFKTFSSRRINQLHRTAGQPVWQRNYYERVIRNQRELDATRKYILDNPAQWSEDAENPGISPFPRVYPRRGRYEHCPCRDKHHQPYWRKDNGTAGTD